MSKQTKHILIVAGVAFGCYAAYAIFSVISAGEKSLAKIILSPFTALSGVWSAITGLFSGSTPSVTVNPVLQPLIKNDTTDAAVPGEAAALNTDWASDPNNFQTVWGNAAAGN